MVIHFDLRLAILISFKNNEWSYIAPPTVTLISSNPACLHKNQ